MLPEHCKTKSCVGPECDKVAIAKGLCSGHYSQMRDGKSLSPINRNRVKVECSVDGCVLVARTRGYCNGHWSRYYKYGDPTYVPPPRVPKWKDRLCKFDGCERIVYAKGLCRTHSRKAASGETLKPLMLQVQSDGRCRVDWCEEKHRAGGYCADHYRKVKVGANLERRPEQLTCPDCHSSFDVYNGGPIPARCNDCANRRHGLQQSRKRIARGYGMTEDEYWSMMAEQNYACQICGEPETRGHAAKSGHLSIDHDHETGKVRGLLCILCNCILGYAHDDPNILRNAIDYLEATA